MELVWPARIRSIRSLNVHSWLFGAALTIPFLLTTCLLLSVSWSLPGILIVLATVAFVDLIVIPLWGLKYWRFQLATWNRRLRAIFWASTGLLTIPYSTILVVWVAGSRSPNTRMSHVVFNYLGIHLAIIVIWILMSLPAWAVIKSRWPFYFQDGSSCPQCGYCVRGVSSRICPECGRAFDEKDLGLSALDFDNLISGETGVQGVSHVR